MHMPGLHDHPASLDRLRMRENFVARRRALILSVSKDAQREPPSEGVAGETRRRLGQTRHWRGEPRTDTLALGTKASCPPTVGGDGHPDQDKSGLLRDSAGSRRATAL